MSEIKGDISLVETVFVVAITFFMIAILAPMLTQYVFTGQIEQVRQDSMNKYASYSILAATTQDPETMSSLRALNPSSVNLGVDGSFSDEELAYHWSLSRWEGDEGRFETIESDGSKNPYMRFSSVYIASPDPDRRKLTLGIELMLGLSPNLETLSGSKVGL